MSVTEDVGATTPTPPAIKEWPCLFTRRADEVFCHLASRDPHMNVQCAEISCQSPWRVCTECSRKGTSNASQVIDPERGLCARHAVPRINHGASFSHTGKLQLHQLRVLPTDLEGRVIPLNLIQSTPVIEDRSGPSLLASVQQCGVLLPIVVRPIPPTSDGHEYLVEDGNLRLWAARTAGLETLHCLVMPPGSSDAERLLRTGVYHCNRVELTVPQQVQLVVYLAKLFSDQESHLNSKYSPDRKSLLTKLQTLLGRSRNWVNDRLVLSQLCPEVLALVGERKDQKGIGIEQALLIANLPPDVQRARAESLMGVAREDAVLALSVESQPVHSYTWSSSAGGRSGKAARKVTAPTNREAACSRKAQAAVTNALAGLNEFSSMSDTAIRCALNRVGARGPEVFLNDLQALEKMVVTVRAQIKRSCRLT